MSADWVVLGKISGLYGVQGWVKVFSYTEPRAAIVNYRPLYLQQPRQQWQADELEGGRAHGKGVVLKFADIDDRDRASQLIAAEVAITREQLPPPAAGEYYWVDLQGLQVIADTGQVLGKIEYLFSTGANDVMVVKGDRERLIPFLQNDVVKTIDLDRRIMRVDWDPDF